MPVKNLRYKKTDFIRIAVASLLLNTAMWAAMMLSLAYVGSNLTERAGQEAGGSSVLDIRFSGGEPAEIPKEGERRMDAAL